MDINQITQSEISTKRIPVRSKLLPPELLTIVDSINEDSRNESENDGNTINTIKTGLFDDEDEWDDESFAIPWDDIARSWSRSICGENYSNTIPKRTPIKH